jgi:hypothetical protein
VARPACSAVVGHAGVALANRALQLTVEALIVEIQLHAFYFLLKSLMTPTSAMTEICKHGAQRFAVDMYGTGKGMVD